MPGENFYAAPTCHHATQGMTPRGPQVIWATCSKSHYNVQDMWWTDGKEGEVVQLSIVKKGGTGDTKGGRISLL